MAVQLAITFLFVGIVAGADAQYQQYMKQSAGGSQGQQGGSDYQKYMKQSTGGQQGQQGGADYQKYMKQYTGGQQGQQGGADYQKYIKQYAGGQQGHQGQQGGFDYQQYMKQSSHNMTGNQSSQKQQYVDEYAGPYQKYMHHEKAAAKAPQHAKDCKTVPQLCAWLSKKIGSIVEYVPSPYQGQATSKLGESFVAELPRIAAINNETVNATHCQDKRAQAAVEKALKQKTKADKAAAEKATSARTVDAKQPGVDKNDEARPVADKAADDKAAVAAKADMNKASSSVVEEKAAVAKAAVDNGSLATGVAKPQLRLQKPVEAKVSEARVEKLAPVAVAQSQLSESAPSTSGLFGPMIAAAFLACVLLALVVAKVRANRRVSDQDYGALLA